MMTEQQRLDAIYSLEEYGFAKVTMREILRVVCETRGVTPQVVTGTSHLAEAVLPRHLISYVAYEYGHSYSAIGRFLGNRDHTTIINGHRRISRRIDEFAGILAQIKAKLDVRKAEFDRQLWSNLGEKHRSAKRAGANHAIDSHVS